MHIHKLITTTLLTAIVLVGLNANGQLPFPPPGPTAHSARNIQAEVAKMTQRYGLSEDQATKVTTVLREQTKKTEEVFDDTTLTMQQRFTRVQSLKEDEISRVSEVLTPEQKQKYESDVRPAPPTQSPSSGAVPALPSLPSNQ